MLSGVTFRNAPDARVQAARSFDVRSRPSRTSTSAATSASIGMPPHRYQTSRRMERAELLLAKRAFSVTDIGMTMGFGSTSSFTAAFRKAIGCTPTDYHRSLG